MSYYDIIRGTYILIYVCIKEVIDDENIKKISITYT